MKFNFKFQLTFLGSCNAVLLNPVTHMATSNAEKWSSRQKNGRRAPSLGIFKKSQAFSLKYYGRTATPCEDQHQTSVISYTTSTLDL